jgi:hypothetical protein
MKDNKLIAEFMGYKFYNNLPQQRNGYQLPKDKGTAIYLAYSTSELQYHKSWDWLMLVVKKCFRTGDDTHQWDNIMDSIFTCDRDIVYRQVVEFINEYNRTDSVVYPFKEGDDYWTIEDGEIIWSCWDDVSEEMHDKNPNKEYFITKESAINYLKQ